MDGHDRICPAGTQPRRQAAAHNWRTPERALRRQPDRRLVSRCWPDRRQSPKPDPRPRSSASWTLLSRSSGSGRDLPLRPHGSQTPVASRLPCTPGRRRDTPRRCALRNRWGFAYAIWRDRCRSDNSRCRATARRPGWQSSPGSRKAPCGLPHRGHLSPPAFRCGKAEPSRGWSERPCSRPREPRSGSCCPFDPDLFQSTKEPCSRQRLQNSWLDLFLLLWTGHMPYWSSQNWRETLSRQTKSTCEPYILPLF